MAVAFWRTVHMNLIKGVKYNIRGLGMGLRTPRLLMLGLIRFFVVIMITMGAASLILVYHQEILNFIWSKPESRWILWLWYLLSWLLSAVLVGLSAVLSYLVSQILFSVLIMDLMSRITEASVTGKVQAPGNVPMWQQFLFLIKQEIPRGLSIPLYSVINRNDGRIVYVVEDNYAIAKSVTLGLLDGWRVEVRKGLKPGEQVIVVGHRSVNNGQLVNVVRNVNSPEDIVQ